MTMINKDDLSLNRQAIVKRHAEEIEKQGADVVSIIATWPDGKSERWLIMKMKQKKSNRK